MKILPYKMGSKSAKALGTALGCTRVRHDGNFRNNYNHTILNWGSSLEPEFPYERMINNTLAVQVAANKLYSFRQLALNSVPVPTFTTDPMVANEWEGDIVARYKLCGHSGEGIVIIPDGTNLINYNDGRLREYAPLYVQYIKKQDEYRYHVFQGQVIDIQQKKKRRSVDNDEVNYQVRNSSNGWVYARDDINPNASLSNISLNAVEALGLEFGAVDVIWNEHQQQGYVLEVNTAPGLEGTTVDKYSHALRRYYE